MNVNMQSLMKQMQKVQAESARVQEEIAQTTVEGTSGGGAVKIVLSGAYEVKKIEIAAEVLETPDKEMLEDLVRGALEDALGRVTALTRDALSKAMGGMKIPGMF